MSSRADKALKQQKEKYHAILRELVKEVPNKTCADCLGKGPRWASWNLGVFVCIRCAGIHRNLGVHLSKVKSVDLDSWNTDQIESMLKWGNKRAAEYFEHYLPQDYTRPHGNHEVEAFIRNKYEKKLYAMKNAEPEPNPSSMLNRVKQTESLPEKEKVKTNKRRERPEKTNELKPASNETILNVAKQNSPSTLVVTSEEPKKSSSMNDLLSLDTSTSNTPVIPSSASNSDLLNFNANQPDQPSLFQTNNFQTSNIITTTTPAGAPVSTMPEHAFASNPINTAQKSTKESILSLYANNSNQQQNVYGIPGGVYMTQPQQQMLPQQQHGMYAFQTNQMNQMNIQMNQMRMTNQPYQKQQYNSQAGFAQKMPSYSVPQQNGFPSNQNYANAAYPTNTGAFVNNQSGLAAQQGAFQTANYPQQFQNGAAVNVNNTWSTTNTPQGGGYTLNCQLWN